MKDKIRDHRLARLNDFVSRQTQYSTITGEVYLAAGGYYQDRYIAIFEELTSDDINARSNQSNGGNEQNVLFIARLFIDQLISKYPDKIFPFNKIVSITLPSQIIAKAIHELLTMRSDIAYYQADSGLGSNSKVSGAQLPSLIRLSSYYSFAEEVQFRNIQPTDKILIVNDVISTGSLLSDILDKLSFISANTVQQNAKIASVLTVVDSRVPDHLIIPTEHRRSIYFEKDSRFSEDDIISLTKVEIIKFNKNPFPKHKLVRINPILNARITIESKHSEEGRMAFKDGDTFIEMLPERSLIMGHFSQNSLHHAYFVKSDQLFQGTIERGNDGIKLVKKIYREVAIKEFALDTTFIARSIIQQMDLFADQISKISPQSVHHFQKYKTELKDYLGRLNKRAKSHKIKSQSQDFMLNHDDFVFYPVFSGIENLHKNNISDIFKVDFSNIIPLQRFDTNKGWRFIIPQKNLNSRVKGKQALIIDLGSFTGDSIIQMIDALCVLELRKIIVISLIGRLEDFDREFFSRIRQMKIKALHAHARPVSTQSSLAPVNIYFGTNLHIPPFQPAKGCPFCQELQILNGYIGQREFESTSAKYFLRRRIEELPTEHVDNISSQYPYYMPIRWADKKCDIKAMFKTRDHLGKIDGYRFYVDYYSYFDNLDTSRPDYKQKIEALMAVVLHEKHLMKTISNQLPDLKAKLVIYVNAIISGKRKMTNLFYQWPRLSILKLHFIVNHSKEVFDLAKYSAVLNFAMGGQEELSFLSFKMAEALIQSKKGGAYYQTNLIKTIKDIWFKIEDDGKRPYYSIITEFNRLIAQDQINTASESVAAFFRLFRLYDEASAFKPSHNELSTNIGNLQSIIIGHFSNSPTSSFDEVRFRREYDITRIQLDELAKLIGGVGSYIRSMINLLKSSSFAKEYISGTKSLTKYIERLDILIKSNDQIGSNLSNINSVLDNIDREYFDISGTENFYSLWKKTGYISARQVLNRFKDDQDNSADFFGKYVRKKNYSDLLKNQLEVFEVECNESYEEVGVNIHPYLLIMIFKEILDNAIKHAPNSKLTVTLATKSTGGSDVPFTVAIFRQNKNATGSPTRGLADAIRVLRDFSGNLSYENIKGHLVIEVEIPNTMYENVV